MSDSPFVGPTYWLRSRPASVQRTVNLIPVRLESQERVRWVLVDVPGLVLISDALYYTSWPYPLFADESLDADLSIPLGGQIWVPPLEELDADLSTPRSGTLDTVLNLYDDALAENLDADLSTPRSGTLDEILVAYDAPAQEMDADLSVPRSGTLVVVLVVYADWPADELDADLSIPLSGTLA